MSFMSIDIIKDIDFANYPISLNYYPYNNCKIYKDIDYNSFYFIYTEWGGHSPEKRCRLIQEKLIVT